MHFAALAFIAAASWTVSASPQGATSVSFSSSHVPVPSYSSSFADVSSFSVSSSATTIPVVSTSVSAVQSCHTDGVPVTVTIVAPTTVPTHYSSSLAVVDRRDQNPPVTLSTEFTLSGTSMVPATTITSRSTFACAPTVTVNIPSNDDGTTTIISGTIVGTSSTSISQSGSNPGATGKSFNANGAGSLQSALGGAGILSTLVAAGLGLLV
ncbi:hypothetical protein K474DRAFT_1303022 [Panus rudis PR-1116 ss-1]|nr:hypothetical protein K474DRAFT_1303022 [Panus rudis PR-1116 ss-1]